LSVRVICTCANRKWPPSESELRGKCSWFLVESSAKMAGLKRVSWSEWRPRKATSNSVFPPPYCVSSYAYAFACVCVLTKLLRLGLNPQAHCPICRCSSLRVFRHAGGLHLPLLWSNVSTFIRDGRAFDTLASFCLNWNHGSSESARNAEVTAFLHHNTTHQWSVVPKPSLANGSSIPLDRTPTARSRRDCLRTVWLEDLSLLLDFKLTSK
jgi:hypothetical protein